MKPANQYVHVRALSKGLTILEDLAAHTSGTSGRIAQRTGIHRTTVKRALETLRADGYVWYDELTATYQLTDMVSSLKEGVRPTDLISQLFAEIEEDLASQIPWPVELTTFQEGWMVIRRSTHRLSALSFHHRLLGRHLPCLTTAAGRCYLAFSSQRVRDDIMTIIQVNDLRQTLLARSEAMLWLIDEARALGWSHNNGEWQDESNFSAIAVPIFQHNVVVASLSMVFLKGSLSVQQAATDYYMTLRVAANQIGERLSTLTDV